MNQTERRLYLIQELMQERPEYRKIRIPQGSQDQRQLLRSLMNVRYAAPISKEFEEIQDEYLQEVNVEKTPVAISDMEECYENQIYIWQGDITRLSVGAIVNAANSGMTGCYVPCHNCIDNCIHTYAGIQLRNYCEHMMEEQGYEEPTGQAKITPAFNLPCEYVIHTVGPIVQNRLTAELEQLLRSCYLSCLNIAQEHGLESIAFCCISTGVFRFPNERAAEIAVKTVREFLKESGSTMKIVFNVFKDEDLYIYRNILEASV